MAAMARHPGTAAEAVAAPHEAPSGDGFLRYVDGRGGQGGPGGYGSPRRDGDSLGVAYRRAAGARWVAHPDALDRTYANAGRKPSW
ncbi:hypothetical protein BE20_06525 [Sorangium cellulosum]|uniref:Uncharacterized protein n=1 Tax=Sorangium cellulosum TaxID=56 RepID=A0A150R8W8_SORCE|nr:hypothetical protein BE18_51185 [Sorangium cellulosum]KYF94444.1 hypothetical protein BE20_06525 [Sorangium cellulosum]